MQASPCQMQLSAPHIEISSRRRNPNLHLIDMRWLAWVGTSHKTLGHVAELILCDIKSMIRGVYDG
jgi:hypothetical protein